MKHEEAGWVIPRAKDGSCERTFSVPFEHARLDAAQEEHLRSYVAGWNDRFHLPTAPAAVIHYVIHCSPREPSLLGIELTAAYLCWFFYLNDLPAAPEKHAVLRTFLRMLEGEAPGESPSERAGAEFREAVLRLVGPAELGRMQRWLGVMFDSFDWEIDQKDELPPVRVYLEHRTQFVAV